MRWREWLERVGGKPVEATQSSRTRDDSRSKVPRRRIAKELWRSSWGWIRRLRVWITAGLVIALWFPLYQAATSDTKVFWYGVLAAIVGLVFAGFRAST